MVRIMEAAPKGTPMETFTREYFLSHGITAEEYDAPVEPDPALNKAWADYQEYLKKAESYPVPDLKCGHPGCTNDFKTDFDGVKRCDEHCQPVAINGPSPAPSEPHSPAEYINSSFGKDQPSNPRALALKALSDALASAPPARGGADYGPTETPK